MYATIQNLVDTFGEKEILQLAQAITGLRSNDLTNATNQLAIQKALDDADVEIDAELAGCISIKQIKDLYLAGGSIPALNHFAKDIARYHLYTSIWLASESNGKDHESYRRYTDAIEHIRELCKKKVLVDDEGNLITSKNRILVAARCSKEVDTCCNYCGYRDCGCL